MNDYVQVVTTTEHEAQAVQIGRALVEERLAACVQVVGPITSVYRWQGKIETGREWQCVAKTRRELYAAVEAAIRGLHPYEEPEILAVSVVDGSPTYLAWLDGQVGGQ